MTDEEKQFATLSDEFFDLHPETPRIQEVWRILCDYLFEKQLAVSLPNLNHAFKVRRAAIEKTLDGIPATEWRKTVVEPLFAKHQKENPPRESSKPWGVSTAQWIHSR